VVRMERDYKIYNINELSPGDHLCVLYQTDEEHKALITPYLRSGLENNEKVFYIVDARTSETVLDYLRDDGIDVDPFLESGQLAILSVTESYMKEGVFDPDGMIRMLTEETENALNGGYNALRVTGEMSWALRGLPGSERLIEYETKLNKFFPNNQSLAICQYDCRVFEPEILLDILTTHPIAVLGTEIYQNFYYIPTEDFLAGKAPEITLEHWTENLKLRRKMEEELFASGKKYHDLFDHLSSGVAVYEGVNNGEDFILKDMNPAAENIEHVRKENIIGKGVTEAFPGVKDFGIFKVFQRVWKTGKREYFPENIYKDEKDQGSWRENWVYKMPTGEIVSICNDITDRKKVELALKNSEEKYRQLVENAQEGIWSIDAETKTTFVNQRMAEILGYDVDEMLGKPLFSFMDETGVKLAKYNLERREKGIKEQHDFEFIRKDGNRVYASLETSPILDADGKYLGALAMVADITDRRKMEEEIKKSLEEKEILLKEIHHRVKNNLMIISSLLNLQSQYIKDKTSKNIFKESQNRARSMALIHERLYQSTDLKRINFGDYIRTLSRELFRIYVADTGLIELNINVEDIFLDINTAIPLGLIVNELITNSLKHAFTEGMKGHINVNFHPQDDHYEFIVTDNGIGFPEDLNFQQTDSLGLQLVNSLTSQIGGKIQLKRNNGAEFKITFKDVGV